MKKWGWKFPEIFHSGNSQKISAAAIETTTRRGTSDTTEETLIFSDLTLIFVTALVFWPLGEAMFLEYVDPSNGTFFLNWI